MITPLGQRQIFQAANAEAVRVAHEVSEQMQREQARRISAEAKEAEEQAAVQVVSGPDKIRTEERQGRGGGQEGNPHGKKEEENEGEEGAEQHLDFLA